MLEDSSAQLLKDALHSLEKQEFENFKFNFEESLINKFSKYLEELIKWNRVYNLSGFESVEDHVYRNIIDSLIVAPFVTGKNMMDLGTGAGLPGMLLAILNPEQSWVLLDGNGKKIRFLKHIIQTLQLKNVEAVHERAEKYQTEKKFDAICSRAFNKIPNSLRLCETLFTHKSKFYALKGRVLPEDVNGLPAWSTLSIIQPLNVPKISEERHLIVIDVKPALKN